MCMKLLLLSAGGSRIFGAIARKRNVNRAERPLPRDWIAIALHKACLIFGELFKFT